MRIVRLVLWALVIIVGATTAGVWVGKTYLVPEGQPAASNNIAAAFSRSRYEDAGGPFSLTDTSGNTVTADDLRGKPVAFFFGFTHCPDVCPTALLDAATWLKELGEDAEKLNIVFVSVDPEQDRPENLGAYVKAFDQRIIGLTADTPEEIRDVAERYNVKFEKVPLQSGGYTMNHTSDTLLFDADGKFVDYIPFLSPQMRQNTEVLEAQEAQTMQALRSLISG
ncbi:SCO family protein [Acuticoccus sp. MNP-M23]|uniref:SCO family protein n=1 Tax=Acuticoccus sp. MNP-M23 TaxID=3072793 RepID=UPI002816883D|nr:SCO family protein [Acuticoccus sp. MNP-M23]WMS43325.1 SCO family protein [Acuticoccus sp. MNP-M23]